MYPILLMKSIGKSFEAMGKIIGRERTTVIAALCQAYTEDDVEEGDEYFNVFETEENEDEVIASDLE
jgi:hypothetical protein